MAISGHRYGENTAVNPQRDSDMAMGSQRGWYLRQRAHKWRTKSVGIGRRKYLTIYIYSPSTYLLGYLPTYLSTSTPLHILQEYIGVDTLFDFYILSPS